LALRVKQWGIGVLSRGEPAHPLLKVVYTIMVSMATFSSRWCLSDSARPI